MVARVFHGFGSGVCEALPVQLVNDIFFLHERGKRLGYYTVCLCLGSTGPLYAGYMLAGGYSWRLFFYVEIAFAGALTLLAFFFVEETLYHRVVSGTLTPPNLEEKVAGHQLEITPTNPLIARKTFAQTLKPFSHIDHEADFFGTMWRPFTYYLVPAVFWVVCTYGLYIGLGALAFNYTFPLKIVAPPYNWSQTNSGLIACASAAGYLLAAPFTFTSDRLAAHLTRKNNYIREPEMRLGVLLIPMFIAPAGLIVYGLTAQHNLHWFGYFAGVAMDQWGSYFYFTFTLAYAVDSYYANTSEMLVAMNLGKQAISFGMGFSLLEWILQDGFATVIAGIFCAVLLVNNMMVLVFMWKGKAIRRFTAGTALARLHKRTRTVGMTA